MLDTGNTRQFFRLFGCFSVRMVEIFTFYGII